MPEAAIKKCTKCGKTLARNEFSKDSRKRDGLQCKCKACNAVYRAANSEKIAEYQIGYRVASREKATEYNKAYRAANRDNIAAREAEYRKANREQIAAYKADYHASNRENKASYDSKYRAANQEACRIYKQNRRARKKENGGMISPGIVTRLLKLQMGKCPCCGKPLGDDYHLDHIVPLSLGGLNTDDNIQLLRSTCNLQKSRKHPIDFMRQRGFLL